MNVSDTPKVTDTLIELFKIDMETQKDNPQGNASLAGAEFTWKYYAGSAAFKGRGQVRLKEWLLDGQKRSWDIDEESEGYTDITAGKAIRRAIRHKGRAKGDETQHLTYRIGEVPGFPVMLK